jgi:ribose transport system permease protein
VNEIGKDPAAAQMLNLGSYWVQLIAFIASGRCRFAGLLTVARLGMAMPINGELGLVAPVAGSVIVGINEGRGRVPTGTMLGITNIDNIIMALGAPPYWQGTESGGIVVLAISFDAASPRWHTGTGHATNDTRPETST